MKRSPAFQFYAADYLADEVVQMLSLEEEGVYIRLLAYCWREGSIPSDPKMLSRLCKGASPKILEQVLEAFKPHPNKKGRMTHPRLDQERQKQVDNRERRAKAGKKGAESRWQSDDKAQTSDMAMPSNEHGNAIDLPCDSDNQEQISVMAKNSLSSSSSISSSTSVNSIGSHTARESEQPSNGVHRNSDTPSNPQITAPTIEQVRSAGVLRGVGDDCGEAFFHEMEACGWIDSRQRPIRNWQAALQKYAISWRANDHLRRQSAGRSRASVSDREFERTGIRSTAGDNLKQL